MVKAFNAKRTIRNRRHLAAAALPDRGTVYRPPDPNAGVYTPEGDIDRTFPDRWTVVATEVKCRVGLPEIRGREMIGAGQPQATSQPPFVYDRTVQLQAEDRVKITAAANNPVLVNMVFDVIEAPPDSLDIVRTATLVIVK
jgi:hypothetical protein